MRRDTREIARVVRKRLKAANEPEQEAETDGRGER